MRGKVLFVVVVAALSTRAGIAGASPFCFETGPGYQKCVTSGHDLTPIYQGPKIYDGGNVPWVPNAPEPVYIPVPAPPAAVVPNDGVLIPLLASQVQSKMQAFVDDPANGRTQYDLQFGRVLLARTGDGTFAGTVAVSASGSPDQDVPVSVTTDDAGNMTWHLDP